MYRPCTCPSLLLPQTEARQAGSYAVTDMCELQVTIGKGQGREETRVVTNFTEVIWWAHMSSVGFSWQLKGGRWSRWRELPSKGHTLVSANRKSVHTAWIDQIWTDKWYLFLDDPLKSRAWSSNGLGLSDRCSMPDRSRIFCATMLIPTQVPTQSLCNEV
jgi:hypothetical protein